MYQKSDKQQFHCVSMTPLQAASALEDPTHPHRKKTALDVSLKVAVAAKKYQVSAERNPFLDEDNPFLDDDDDAEVRSVPTWKPPTAWKTAEKDRVHKEEKSAEVSTGLISTASRKEQLKKKMEAAALRQQEEKRAAAEQKARKEAEDRGRRELERDTLIQALATQVAQQTTEHIREDRRQNRVDSIEGSRSGLLSAAGGPKAREASKFATSQRHVQKTPPRKHRRPDAASRIDGVSFDGVLF